MKRIKAKTDLYFDEMVKKYATYRVRNNGTCRNVCYKNEYYFLLNGKERVDYSLLKRLYPYIDNPNFFVKWVIVRDDLTIIFQTGNENALKHFLNKYFVVYTFIDCEEEYIQRLKMIGRSEKAMKLLDIHVEKDKI